MQLGRPPARNDARDELIGPTSNEAQGGCKGARRWMSSRSAELTYRSGASKVIEAQNEDFENDGSEANRN